MFDFLKSTEKKRIEEFLKETQSATSNRKKLFDDLVSFTLEGKQWTDSEKVKREAEGLGSLVLNFSEDFTTRYLAKLFPKNLRTGVMEVGVKTYDDSDSKLSKEILRVYQENDLPAVLMEQGQDFLVGGAACLFYPKNPITNTADILSLDPSTVRLGFKNRKLVQFAYFEDGTLNGQDSPLFYMDLENFMIKDKSGKITTTKNTYNFIPFSWIPCRPKPHNHEGISRVLPLYGLDIESNSRFSDFSKRIEENTFPHEVIFSDVAKAENYKKGKNGISQLGKDDDAKFMELNESSAVLEYIEALDARMRRKTGLVDSAGSVQAAISGVSLSYQYSDMLDLIGFMRIHWDRAFREMNRAILTYKFGEKQYKTDPVYNSALAYDSKSKTEEVIQMLTNDLISHTDAIDELRGGENPAEKLAEILKEKKLFEIPEKNPIESNI